jgi:hypothetical protein
MTPAQAIIDVINFNAGVQTVHWVHFSIHT